MRNRIYRFLITGGPCAGKSQSLSILEETFVQKGYAFICVPESATALIAAGISPQTGSNLRFQTEQLRMQLEKEKLANRQAQVLSMDKTALIFYDRGLLDGKAFSTPEEFQSALESCSVDEASILGRYDAVFHLESTAKLADGCYSNQDNPWRISSRQEARESDQALQTIYRRHPAWYFIEARENRSEKMKRLIDAVCEQIDTMNQKDDRNSAQLDTV